MIKKILFSLLFLLSAANISKAQTVADGTTEYTGEVVVHVDKNYSCPNVIYTITKNNDGTIDLVLPEFTLEKTTIGTISVGSYTVKNISFNNTEKKYFRDYTSDGLSMHLTVSGAIMNIDGDYAIEKTGNISVTISNDGQATIVNNFQPGKMPFLITSTFTSNSSSDIQNISTSRNNSGKAYTLSGITVSQNSSVDSDNTENPSTPSNGFGNGIVIMNGKKFLTKKR